MPPRTLNLYHVTLFERAVRILDSGGINPEFSQGRRKVCWYATKRIVTWVIPHVMQRHSAQLVDIAILHVKVGYTKVYRSSKTGIYACPVILKPDSMDGAEMWLAREEKYIVVEGHPHYGGGFLGKRFKDENELP